MERFWKRRSVAGSMVVAAGGSGVLWSVAGRVLVNDGARGFRVEELTGTSMVFRSVP